MEFPHVIGSIDGKHVTLKQPANTGSQFFNYKQNFSIVLLGRISDGGVLANSAIYERLERRELNIPVPEILQIPYNIEVPYFFLGDQAFAFKEYCLRPFSGMHAANSIERLFNYRHSRARRTVENDFGIDAKRKKLSLQQYICTISNADIYFGTIIQHFLHALEIRHLHLKNLTLNPLFQCYLFDMLL
uniref:Uncharacterized protein n=1 Tax=Anopheles arabiensis TaxID=7173 RepID=A0A182IHZ2_ANOAR